MITHQRGSALVLSLVILLVMTLLGITAMNTSVLEEKMASNDRNQKLAFQNAESGLSQAEQIILDTDWYSAAGLNSFFSTDDNGYYATGQAPADVYDSSGWACVAGKSITGTSIAVGGEPPCYMIENMGIEPPLTSQQYGSANFSTQISRITTMGSANAGVTTVLLQSHFQKELIP